MHNKLQLHEPRPYHRNDKQNIRKRRKMEHRAKHRDNPSSIQHGFFDRGYAPPTGSACYKRWAWLFRP